MLLHPDHMTPPAGDARRQAKHLYWMCWSHVDIAAYLNVSASTVRSWCSRDKWDQASVLERMEGATEARYVGLVCKPVKSGSDYKEIDLLARQIGRMARIRRYEAPGGHEGDLNQRVGDRNKAASKARPERNHFDEAAIAKLEEAFRDGLFGYQVNWWNNSEERTREILKSRQVGATWYFAREALLKAVKTGRNQIFLSASKNQAHLFRQYMVAFAREACGVELTGDPITLSNGAIIYFLGTNARTAQGYHGDFYFDEFFWTFRFKELNRVASAMATHKHWKKTYFSSPSSVNHEAFPFWSGDAWNRLRPKEQRQSIDVSPLGLRNGAVGADRVWRNIVTVEDAAAHGCDLFDIEELRQEYSPPDFANLFMCEFIDDSMSVFPLAMLQPCMVDAYEEWQDFRPFSPRPYIGPVWVGYDPSLTGDAAALVVVAPPSIAGSGKFRVLEKHQFRGMDFADQAEAIRKITKKYQVTYIGIDATGIGQGVYQLVKAFFPTARAINYSAETKVGLVLKALDCVRRGRFEFDAGWTDLAAAFMAIRKALTASGRAVTYEAGRSEETGHADLAWATMHALANEPLEAGMVGGRVSRMEIFD